MFTTQQLILLSKFWLQTLRLNKARHFPVNFIKIVTLLLQFHNIMAEDGNGFNRENGSFKNQTSTSEERQRASKEANHIWAR